MLVPAKDVWLPDIAVLNSEGKDGFLSINDKNMVSLCPFGSVYLLIKAESIRTRCKLDATKYPYDKQTCSIDIGSWTNTFNIIQFSSQSNIDKEGYIENTEYDLLNISFSTRITKERMAYKAYINSDFFSEDERSFHELSFVWHIKRKPLNFMINYVLVNLILNVALLLTFFLPHSTALGLCNDTKKTL